MLPPRPPLSRYCGGMSSKRTIRLRRHPQASQTPRMVMEWTFTCPECEPGWVWPLRTARVQLDGSLLCRDHAPAGADPFARGDWCPGCSRALDPAEFRLPDLAEDDPVHAVWVAFGSPVRTDRLCSTCRRTGPGGDLRAMRRRPGSSPADRRPVLLEPLPGRRPPSPYSLGLNP